MNNYLLTAFEEGVKAKRDGYERRNPYGKLLAGIYWLRGYDGVSIHGE